MKHQSQNKKKRARFIFTVIAFGVFSFVSFNLVFGWVDPTGAPPISSGGIYATSSVSLTGAIGTFSPILGPASSTLAIAGALSVGTYGGNTAPAGSTIVSGQVGIGLPPSGAQNVSTFVNTLSVADTAGIVGVAIGINYATTTSPANGLIVEGNLGIGTSTPLSRLSIEGGGMSLGGTLQTGTAQSNIALTNAITAITDPSASGSIKGVVNIDGLPIFMYQSSTFFTLRKCSKIDCSSGLGNNYFINETGTSNAMIIGTDGNLAMSYVTGIYVKVLHCLNSSCTSPGLSMLAGNFGTSIVSGPIYPIVSYTDNVGSLKIATCGDFRCGNFVASGAIESGKFSSIGIGTDGLAIVSYAGPSNTLKVAKCLDGNCNINPITISEVDSGVNISTASTDMTIGAEGLPIIVYTSSSPSVVKVAKCRLFNCSGGSVVLTQIDNVTADSVSLTIPADGLPLIAYHTTGGDYRVVKCGDPGCDTNRVPNAPAVIIPVSTATPGSISVSIGVDGLPILGILDATNKFKTIHCGNVRCVPYWTRK